MVGNKLELDIIRLYESNLVNLFSINQIAGLLGKKYPYINKKVTQLLEKGILNKIVVGKAYLCSLNLTNPMTILMLSALNVSKSKKDSKIGEFLDKNRFTLSIQCVVNYNSKMVFVVHDLRDRRRIQRVFEKCTIVDEKEFLDMVIEEQKLFSNHQIQYGIEKFYELITTELDELKRLHSPLRY